MLTVDKWTVFYADESTFTSEQGSWAEAPAFGVNCVVYYLLPECDTCGGTGEYHTDLMTQEWGKCPDCDGKVGKATVDTQGSDVSIYEYRGTTAGSDELYKMGLWTDGESFWRVHDLAMRTTTP